MTTGTIAMERQDNYLALYFESTMQSWGTSGKFSDHRPTGEVPSRSAVMGMLANACGIDKYDERQDAEWCEMARELRFWSYCVRPGTKLTDYQTVGGGYDSNDPMMPKTAEEGPRKQAVILNKHYLCGAVTGAVVAGGDFVVELAEAARNPARTLFLGRKCCIPAVPVFAGVHGSLEEAENAILERYRLLHDMAERPRFALRSEPSCTVDCDELVPDIPVSFLHRRFFYSSRKLSHASV